MPSSVVACIRRLVIARDAVAVLIGVVAIQGTALAHGGLFRPDEVLVEPGNEAHVVVRSDVWGMVETRDAGQSWHWICAEAAHDDSLSVLRRSVVLLQGGTLLVRLGSGIARSKESFCDFVNVPFSGSSNACAGDCLVFDVAPDAPGTPSALALTTYNVNGLYDNRLFRTTDAGQTWTPFGALPQDVVASGVRVAPSDPNRVYVGAVTSTAPQMPFLLRSNDAGLTWQRSSLPPPDDPSARLWIRDVHPMDPDVVFIWYDAEAGTLIAPDRLLVSADGGLTFPIVFDAKDDLPGLAVAPDGSVFIGGTGDGVWSAALADIKAGKPDAFHPINMGPTWGLAWIEQGLLAGREEYVTQTDEPRMSLGLSCDLGATFSPAMRLCDVTLAECTSGTTAGDNCSSLYYGPLNFEEDFVTSRQCDAPGVQSRIACGTGGSSMGLDAGGAGTGGAGGGSTENAGCGCRTSRDAFGGSQWWLDLTCALGLLRRSSRRKRSRENKWNAFS